MKILLNATWIGPAVGVGGFALTILTLYVSNLLKDKMKQTEHEVEIENLKQRVRDLEQRFNGNIK